MQIYTRKTSKFRHTMQIFSMLNPYHEKQRNESYGSKANRMNVTKYISGHVLISWNFSPAHVAPVLLAACCWTMNVENKGGGRQLPTVQEIFTCRPLKDIKVGGKEVTNKEKGKYWNLKCKKGTQRSGGMAPLIRNDLVLPPLIKRPVSIKYEAQ